MAVVHISHNMIEKEPELMDLVFDKFGSPTDVSTVQDKINGRSVLKFQINNYEENELVEIGIFRFSDGSIVCDTLRNLLIHAGL